MRALNTNRRLSVTLFIAFLFMPCSHPVMADAPVETVELFGAIDAGQVAVKFIPTSAAKANVLIENMTDLVLHVELPDAIAAVPVLAQFGQGPGQNDRGGGGFAGFSAGGQNGNASQGVGGGLNQGNGRGLGNGFGNGGNQFGGNQFGGNNLGQQGGVNGLGMGFMRIAPQKTRKLTARTVCLEHGKPDPNPRIAYRMIPIELLTDDTEVAELCRQLGRGEVAQKTAQAAAWHLASGLSWEQLAGINRMESRYLGNIKFFQPGELKRAKEFVTSLRASAETTLDDYAAAR